MDGGAWWAAVHGVSMTRTRLKQLSSSSSSSSSSSIFSLVAFSILSILSWKHLLVHRENRKDQELTLSTSCSHPDIWNSCPNGIASLLFSEPHSSTDPGPHALLSQWRLESISFPLSSWHHQMLLLCLFFLIEIYVCLFSISYFKTAIQTFALITSS